MRLKPNIPPSPKLTKPSAPGMAVVELPSKEPRVATELSTLEPVASVPNNFGSIGVRCVPGVKKVPLVLKSKTDKPVNAAAFAAVPTNVEDNLMASRSKPENCPLAPPSRSYYQ